MFDEGLLACMPNSVFVSSNVQFYIPIFPYSAPIMVSSSSYDDYEIENPPPLDYHISIESIEHEPTQTPQLPTWVHTT
jgi:hypothetical protein